MPDLGSAAEPLVTTAGEGDEDMAEDQRIRVRDRRRKGWFSVDHLVIDIYGPILGPYGIATYAAIVRHADNSAQSWVISIGELSAKTKIGRTKLHETIELLERLELIEVVNRFSERGQVENEYLLLHVAPTPPANWETRGRVERAVDDPRSPREYLDLEGCSPDEGGSYPVRHANGVPSATRTGPIHAANGASSQGEDKPLTEKQLLQELDSQQLIRAAFERVAPKAGSIRSTQVMDLVNVGLVTLDDAELLRSTAIGRGYLRQVGLT